METSLPEWMTVKFFEECLKKEEGNSDIVVTNLTASEVVPPGNNYGSYIVRVSLDWKTNVDDPALQSLKLIVKAELQGGPMKDVASAFGANEPSYYYNFIPRAKQFSDINFTAKCFFSPIPNVTILEDLKEKGFVMADRMKQLDFDHCRLYMIAAASFHAISVPVFKEYPELLEPINKEVMYSDESKMRDMFELLIKGGMYKFAEEIEKLDRFRKYTGLIEELTPKLWGMLVEAHKPSEVVNTIKQGDPWLTNMMFKYDDGGEVCDVKIIDFQGTSYGSPVADVMFFIWSSANANVKKNNLDKLYNIYVESFNENLEKFGCTERLSHEQMMEHVERFSPLALFMSTSFLPTILHHTPMDASVFFSEERNEETTRFYEERYTDSYCSNIFPDVVEALEINGVFNYLEKHKE